jgi:predicted metalloprotease
MSPGAPDRPRRRPAALATCAAGLLVLSACAVDHGVVSVGAEQSSAIATPPATSTPGTDPASPSTTAPTTAAPVETVPPTEPPRGDPELLADVPIGDVVDIDDAKPQREYDPFVGVAVADIERWWGEQYPEIYGEPFEALANGIYAGYPERQTDLPGCGEPVTDYEDLNQFAAFYCALDDFMIYDDGDESLLKDLAEHFGPAVMGIVIAHEYGHAIQQRIGALDRFIATIYTEQQADCYAGAWTGQAYRGESPLLRLGDNDVRAGLIAMLEVRDPVGFSQFEAGGHGSAFDRVGAFQEGFLNGPGRCAELLDDPLTLMPNVFRDQTDAALEGNAVYDCEELRDFGATEEQIAECTPAPVFLADDLNDFWNVYLGDEFPDMTAEPVDDLGSAGCDDPVTLALDAALCASTDTVVYDEPDVVELYREFGDFTLGYFYGIAWSERAQQIEGSALTGERRALLNDCYTGAWTGDITPDEAGATPRRRDVDGDGVADLGTITSSPGDLDEAIRMAILVGDGGANANIVGSPFEKIAAFRVGVLGGLDACRTQFAG